MAVDFIAIGTFASGTTSVTLTYPVTPTDHRIAVAVVDTGHPTAGITPTGPDGWALVGPVSGFEGGGGVYGADAGPRRLTLFVRALQGDGTDQEPTFTIPAGTESRVGGVIVVLRNSVGQEVVRYGASFGEDTSSGTAFSAVGSPAIAFSSFTGDLVLLAYAVATDAATFSAEAVAATGITFGTITERGDAPSTTGADVGRAIATGPQTGGGPAAEVPTITATLSSASTGVAAALYVQDLPPDGGPGTITASYDLAASRVRILATRLDPNAATAYLERSTNGVVWKPVRGGYGAPITAVPRTVDTFSVDTANSWGTADATGQTWSTVGGAAGDYDKIGGVGLIALPDTAGRRGEIGPAMADVDIYGDMAVNTSLATGAPINGSVIARYVDSNNHYRVRIRFDTDDTVDLILERVVGGVGTALVTVNTALNVYGALEFFRVRFQLRGPTLKAKVWRAVDPEPAAWAATAVDLSHTSGNVGFLASIQAGNTNVNPGMQFDNFSASEFAVEVDDYEFVSGVTNTYRITTHDLGLVVTDIETTTVTPVLDRIWLKSVVRPFLNREVLVVGFTDPERPARSSEYDIVSRTLPVAVNDLRSSRRWQVSLYVDNAADAQTLDYALAAGDVMLLHTPAGCDVPGGYVQIKDYGQRHPAGRVRGQSRVFTLPLVEVAPPGPDVLATVSTWTSVLAAFATWDDVLAAFPTWQDVLDYIGDPAEVIVS